MTKSYKQTHKYKKFKYTVKTNMYDIHLNKVNIYQKKNGNCTIIHLKKKSVQY